MKLELVESGRWSYLFVACYDTRSIGLVLSSSTRQGCAYAIAHIKWFWSSFTIVLINISNLIGFKICNSVRSKFTKIALVDIMIDL